MTVVQGQRENLPTTDYAESSRSLASIIRKKPTVNDGKFSTEIWIFSSVLGIFILGVFLVGFFFLIGRNAAAAEQLSNLFKRNIKLEHELEIEKKFSRQLQHEVQLAAARLEASGDARKKAIARRLKNASENKPT